VTANPGFTPGQKPVCCDSGNFYVLTIPRALLIMAFVRKNRWQFRKRRDAVLRKTKIIGTTTSEGENHESIK
jgi:hypothetical protein